MRLLVTGALLIGLAGCASADAGGGDFVEMMGGSSPAEAARIAARLQDKPLGSAQNPVRADMPGGQQAYLARLRCSNGRPPTFHRNGNIGPGPYGSIVDAYQVDCPGASPASSVIHLDMYHPGHVETAAPSGFTIVP
jgi:hypothetical protein